MLPFHYNVSMFLVAPKKKSTANVWSIAITIYFGRLPAISKRLTCGFIALLLFVVQPCSLWAKIIY